MALLLVERRLVVEVERVQAFDEGEASELGPHGDVLGRLGGDLFGEDLIEEVGVGELLAGRLLQEGFEALPALEQAQALQVLLEALELGGGHAGTAARVRSGAPAASGAALARGAATSVSPRSAS